MKTIISLVLSSILGGGVLLAADFSTKSDIEFINLAGNIPASDVPDYQIELKKRINTKMYEEAKTFKRAVKQSRCNTSSNLTPEQAQKRAVEVCKAFESKIASMSGAQILESGLKVKQKDCNEVGYKVAKKQAKNQSKFFKECNDDLL